MLVRLLAVVWSTAILFGSSAIAQNIEGGIHGGFGKIGDDTFLGSETNAAYGAWLLLWPTDRFSIAADWTYMARPSFEYSIGDFLVGETDRNRQYVDITLQFHIMKEEPIGLFIEAGGGAHWNNRQVVNPNGVPEFEEQGKESTRQSIWTVGGGFRIKLVKHIHWITGVKFHNPGENTSYGSRFLTGITVSLR